MRVAVFSAKDYDGRFLTAARPDDPELDLDFLETRLDGRTAGLAAGHEAVCVFVEDEVSALARTRPGVMLVNTSRGGPLDTAAVIAGLKSGRIGHLGIDVYEEEAALFFEDRSERGAFDDDLFARLLTFPNVLVTGHQGFFTAEALTRIAEVTIGNLVGVARGTGPPHPVVPAG